MPGHGGVEGLGHAAYLVIAPTAGASPWETVDILSLVRRLQKVRGHTLLFTEHDTAFVLAIATG